MYDICIIATAPAQSVARATAAATALHQLNPANRPHKSPFTRPGRGGWRASYWLMEAVQVKERPWAAKQHEVLSIIAGRKTQLRILAPEFKEENNLDAILKLHPNQRGCPLGEVGERLWVRESFVHRGKYDCYYYRADHEAHAQPYAHDGWKSPATMPRRASRLLLEITAVRVERLQMISRQDCINEGIQRCEGLSYKLYGKHDKQNYPGTGLAVAGTAKESFETLWQSINGPESWAANPWVWVVEFKVVSPAPTLE